MCHAPVCLISLRPSLRTLHLSLPSSTSSSLSFTSSSMWIGSEQNLLCASANEESGPLVNNAPLTHLTHPFLFNDTANTFQQPSCGTFSWFRDSTSKRPREMPNWGNSVPTVFAKYSEKGGVRCCALGCWVGCCVGCCLLGVVEWVLGGWVIF